MLGRVHVDVIAPVNIESAQLCQLLRQHLESLLVSEVDIRRRIDKTTVGFVHRETMILQDSKKLDPRVHLDQVFDLIL